VTPPSSPRSIFRATAVERYANGAPSAAPVAPTRAPRVVMLYFAIAGCVALGIVMVGLLLRATQA
jgi:hypothetical protein